MRASGRFLFIHQNFPGQFIHLAQALARRGSEVVALGIKGREVPGVRYRRYAVAPPARASELAQARDLEAKLARAIACRSAMAALQAEGFAPDVIVAHPGWGEALFCKDVWPAARLVVFAEFFYSTEDSDYAFDPEFHEDTLEARARLRLKNTVHLHALAAADAIYSPTLWQRSRLPAEFRAKTEVIFDGIDTRVARPDPAARLKLRRDNVTLAPGDEVITFVNRNLEPYRGFHVFMRALPTILAARPNARCLIVGRESVSYGAPPAGGGTWREAMLREVGARLPMDRVHFLGGLPYSDYLRVLQVSACHVYLTYPFVLSWSCLEAMSVGCQLLASATAPVEEVVRDGVEGQLFPFFDGAALAERACRLLEHRHRNATGAAARERVVADYDLQSVCLPRQLALVDRVLGLGPLPAGSPTYGTVTP